MARLSILPEQLQVPAGGSGWVLVRLEIEPEWHVYWRNPGDSGVPVELTWTLPEGLTAGRIHWPRPEVFRSPWEVTYGYADRVGLLVEIRAAPTITPGPRTASVRCDWMICKEMCLMGGASRAFEVAVSPKVAGGPGPAAEAAEIARWRREVPGKAPEDVALVAEIEIERPRRDGEEVVRGVLRVSGRAGKHRVVRFLPDANPGTTWPPGGPTEGRVASGRFEVEVPVSVRRGDAGDEPLVISGILCLGNARSDPAFVVRIPLAESDDVIRDAPSP